MNKDFIPSQMHQGLAGMYTVDQVKQGGTGQDAPSVRHKEFRWLACRRSWLSWVFVRAIEQRSFVGMSIRGQAGHMQVKCHLMNLSDSEAF